MTKTVRTFAKWAIVIALFIYAIELMEDHFGFFVLIALGAVAGIFLKNKFSRKRK